MADIYLPKSKSLSSSVDAKDLEEYFRTIGTIPGKLKLQCYFVEDLSCKQKMLSSIASIETLIHTITSVLLTDTFDTIKNLEHEMLYKSREFVKEIDTFLLKKLLESLLKIADLIGFGIDPFNLPVPFLPGVRVLDFLTVEGKNRIKKAIAQDIKTVASFFGDVSDFFSGAYNLNIPEYSVEELFCKAVSWFNQLLNNTVYSIANALFSFIEKIPVIGQLISALGVLVDPTKALDDVFNSIIKGAKDDIDGTIKALLNIQIPIFGSLQSFLNIDLDKELLLYTVHMQEMVLARIKSSWDLVIQKIRSILSFGWLKLVSDILLKAPSFVLSAFPVIGKIINLFKLVLDVITGSITAHDVISIILSPVFTLFEDVYSLLPSECFNYKFDNK